VIKEMRRLRGAANVIYAESRKIWRYIEKREDLFFYEIKKITFERY